MNTKAHDTTLASQISGIHKAIDRAFPKHRPGPAGLRVHAPKPFTLGSAPLWQVSVAVETTSYPTPRAAGGNCCNTTRVDEHEFTGTGETLEGALRGLLHMVEAVAESAPATAPAAPSA